MTDKQHYVNPESTAGSQDGTGQQAGNSGTAAFESMSKYNTSIAEDMTGNTYKVDYVGTTADTVGNSQWTGWSNPSATEFITINGNRTGHTYDTGQARLEVTLTGYQEGLRIEVDFTVINDLQAQATVTTGGGAALFYLGYLEGTVNRCIANGVISGGSFTRGFQTASTHAPDLRACLAYDFTGTSNNGFFINSSSTASFLYNCTAHNNTINFGRDYNDATPRNCLAQSGGTDFTAAGWVSATHNCSEDSSKPGTSGQEGAVVFTDEAGDDFEISDSDTLAKENGVDLSGTFTFDLANNTWPATWSIGAIIPAVAGGAEEFLGRQYPQGVNRGVMRGVT